MPVFPRKIVEDSYDGTESKLETGQLVIVRGLGLAIILYEVADVDMHWAVLKKKKETADGGNQQIIIKVVHVRDIKSYSNHCWHCPTDLNSFKDQTCPTCHWLVCPECHRCKEDGCESDGIVIEPMD